MAKRVAAVASLVKPTVVPEESVFTARYWPGALPVTLTLKPVQVGGAGMMVDVSVWVEVATSDTTMVVTSVTVADWTSVAVVVITTTEVIVRVSVRTLVTTELSILVVGLVTYLTCQN